VSQDVRTFERIAGSMYVRVQKDQRGVECGEYRSI